MVNRPLSVQWTSSVKTQTEKEQLELSIRSSTVALSRLKEILEGKLSELLRTETRPSEYDNPSWAYKQAHVNGERQALTEILELFNFLKS